MSTASAAMTWVGTAFAIVFFLSGIAAAAASYKCSNHGGLSESSHHGTDHDHNATSCAQVITKLSPCVGFVDGKEDKPSTQCCGAAKDMVNNAKTKEDRQEICECIKSAAILADKIDPTRINQLVKDCGINIKLPPISKDTDCKTVSFHNSIKSIDHEG